MCCNCCMALVCLLRSERQMLAVAFLPHTYGLRNAACGKLRPWTDRSLDRLDLDRGGGGASQDGSSRDSSALIR